MHALLHNYGTAYRDVLGYLQENSHWAETLAPTQVLKAEVIHAVRQEMAQKLSDVVFRRTDLGTGADPGDLALETCAGLMASELQWDEAKTQQEWEEVQAAFSRPAAV